MLVGVPAVTVAAFHKDDRLGRAVANALCRLSRDPTVPCGSPGGRTDRPPPGPSDRASIWNIQPGPGVPPSILETDPARDPTPAEILQALYASGTLGDAFDDKASVQVAQNKYAPWATGAFEKPVDWALKTFGLTPPTFGEIVASLVEGVWLPDGSRSLGERVDWYTFAGKFYLSLDQSLTSAERQQVVGRGILTNFSVQQNLPDDPPNHTSGVLVRHGDREHGRFIVLSKKDKRDYLERLRQHRLWSGRAGLVPTDVTVLPGEGADDAWVVYELNAADLTQEMRDSAWTLPEFRSGTSTNAEPVLALGFLATDPTASPVDWYEGEPRRTVERAPRVTAGRYRVEDSGRVVLQPEGETRRRWSGQPGGMVLSSDGEAIVGIAGDGEPPQTYAVTRTEGFLEEVARVSGQLGVAGYTPNELLSAGEQVAYRAVLESVEDLERDLAPLLTWTDQDDWVFVDPLVPNNWKDVVTHEDALTKLSETGVNLDRLRRLLHGTSGNSTPLTVYPAGTVRELLIEYFEARGVEDLTRSVEGAVRTRQHWFGPS